jgi:hypothetical protein
MKISLIRNIARLFSHEKGYEGLDNVENSLDWSLYLNKELNGQQPHPADYVAHVLRYAVVGPEGVRLAHKLTSRAR